MLVVDDIRLNRMVLSKLASRAGFFVEEAEDGQVAVQLVLAAAARGDQFSCVLMDLQMPKYVASKLSISSLLHFVKSACQLMA